ncbi:hypothetical protein HYFRA_00000891 [Hymenoscyphus fraxineus]|uniref:Partial AB-hydrolase lipase domain-containing protein n=1 Tax=Hymenoscyphus fraxineus TaxID=746836 RepID=A0A9N9KV93_9HELO|nr:hypothetical protein HYFRA_00000891 [Hymenoscyphus fraxineus]
MNDAPIPLQNHVFPLQNNPLAPPSRKGQNKRPANIDTSGLSRRTPATSATLSGETNVGECEEFLESPQNNELFPSPPDYGTGSDREFKSMVYRPLSFSLSLCCLGLLFAGAIISNIKTSFTRNLLRLIQMDPDSKRPFIREEKRRADLRARDEHIWKTDSDVETQAGTEFMPTEGGEDPVRNDLPYYARRVGLDAEELTVCTEDGFLLTLTHIYDPNEYTPLTALQRKARGADIFTGKPPSRPLPSKFKPKYPILMIHGLMQAAGAFCSHDDASLAFYLCKSGYDVWLGNNRCGFKPSHSWYKSTDPRMWTWTPRDMGTRDLPALTSRVLSETGFEKLGLIAHSQGTTQTFIALSRTQRPSLGLKYSVFCALAPAVYGGSILDKWYFKFVRSLPDSFYTAFFGIHGFFPVMMIAQHHLNSRLYGWSAYIMFNYLFNWSDWNWDRALRDRSFQCSPTYVSSESMRWWLGRNGFATNRCILSTKAELAAEELSESNPNIQASSKPWFDARMPPLALFVAGKDHLVDGQRLMNRFKSGKEPDTRVLHMGYYKDYEHLDVIWAADVVERIGRKIRNLVWKTADSQARERCRVPRGCEGLGRWIDDRREDCGSAETSESDGEWDID